ncbi:MAG TPA: SGNH/GDSL hydrolase family protein [Flavitalea sp.]|nr:SGNH/GDSL hydrolase family protein [Flavitalea sp.]
MKYTYLSLGDSYTIGEGVPLYESYPYQTVQILRQAGKAFNAAEIIAKTGWTTTDLASGIDHTLLTQPYDFVSLLIGVNNQYRGLHTSIYSVEFEELLTSCLSFTEHKPAHVFVLSVPDWGLTPFANGDDRQKITREIQGYNKINSDLSRKFGVTYIDITSASPERANDNTYFADDGLHPSAKAYKRWAQLLSKAILISMEEKR